jgi:hypothetical protein
MNYCIENSKNYHLFNVDMDRVDHKEYRGINWKIFKFCWFIGIGRYLLQILTPWFSLSISSGHQEFFTGVRWYGLRLNWSHPENWNIQEGGLLFTKSDMTLSFTKSEKQRVY